jgi:hypothetical protein
MPRQYLGFLHPALVSQQSQFKKKNLEAPRFSLRFFFSLFLPKNTSGDFSHKKKNIRKMEMSRKTKKKLVFFARRKSFQGKYKKSGKRRMGEKQKKKNLTSEYHLYTQVNICQVFVSFLRFLVLCV